MGSNPPSESTLRLWKKAVSRLSSDEFKALELVAAEDDKDVIDASSTTWAVPGHKGFLDAAPVARRSMVMIISR